VYVYIYILAALAGPHKASYIMGPAVASQGINRPEREIDHPVPTSVEVKNGGAVPPLPIRLHDLLFKSISAGTTLPPLYFTPGSHVTLIQLMLHIINFVRISSFS
jgi:hypothetical protein